jgi:hypothetical protein
MNDISRLGEENIRIGRCTPGDRETPIIEIRNGDEVIFDLSFKDDDPRGEVEILFHHKIGGCILRLSKTRELIESAACRLHESVD